MIMTLVSAGVHAHRYHPPVVRGREGAAVGRSRSLEADDSALRPCHGSRSEPTLDSMMLDDGLELLSDEASMALLGTMGLGRVGVSVGALPAIFPVNYVVVRGDIIFRTGAGLKLRAALDHKVVAFQVDQSGPGQPCQPRLQARGSRGGQVVSGRARPGSGP